jgi:tetratricopeptide (TPR) repeat protein
LLERTLELDPTSDEAMINLGVLAHQAGDRVAARRYYESALAVKPDEPNAQNNLAVLELEQGNRQAALALAEQAVSSDPGYLAGRTTLGWALHDAGHWQRALEQFDWVLKRQPDARDSRVRATRCLLRLDRASQAAANALVVLRQHAGDAEVRGLFAEALARVLLRAPVEQVRQQAINACQNGGVDPLPLLPLVAAELRRLGEAERAAAIERS